MSNSNVKKSTMLIVATALMAALVFVISKFVSIPLFDVFGMPTRVHLGNAMCLLGGLLFGGLSGGLAAGMGSVIFDLLDPLYIASAPITFIEKFLMGFVCGKIAHSKKNHGNSLKMNIIAAICGQLTYVILYTITSFIKMYLKNPVVETALISAGQKCVVSLINAATAVIIAVPLAMIIKKALSKTSFAKIMGEKAKDEE